MASEGRRNIVLTGFMGTGKTVVGRIVAERLSRRFVDMDAVVASRLGMSVAEVFARLGEPFFRYEEGRLCRELAAQEGLVIATGGGALLDPANREALSRSGVLICLNARPDALLARLEGDQMRPLLAQGDREQRVKELLAQRKRYYDEIPHQLDTSELSPEAVAECVIAIAGNAEGVQERVLGVHYPGGFYPVFITEGGLRSLGLYLRSRGLGPSVAIICDETVGAVWADTVWQSLTGAGHAPHLLVFPAGEQSKTLSTVVSLVEGMVRAGLGRDACAVALGGGVVGDTAGLAAGLYMRGIPLVQAPTTVLAAVDSCIGGKVAVDLPAGKNLIGLFKQPAAVVIDVASLQTLQEAERRAGLAEVVKHGLIGDPALFAMMEEGAPDLTTVVERSLRVKIRIVEDDPFELGTRMHLNLGHTFAHAFEKLSGYQLRHGEAVAQGLVCATRLAANRKLCSPDLVSRVVLCLRRLGLPVGPVPFEPDDVLRAMQLDKKRREGKLRFVVPLEVGHVTVISDVADSEVRAALAEG